MGNYADVNFNTIYGNESVFGVLMFRGSIGVRFMRKHFFEISLWKTIVINVRYFGISSLLYPIMLVSKNVYLDELKGSVEYLGRKKLGAVMLGFRYAGNVDPKKNRMIWRNSGIVRFYGDCRIGAGCCLSNGGLMEFGDKFHCTGRSELLCVKHIKFGKNVLISWDTTLLDSDYHNVYNVEKKDIPINEDREIVIGNDCWISCKCFILKGVTVASNTIVAAGTKLVKNQITENNVILSDRNGIGIVIKTGVMH